MVVRAPEVHEKVAGGKPRSACCYAIDLAAWNRTIVNCDTQHTNNAHYTFTVI